MTGADELRPGGPVDGMDGASSPASGGVPSSAPGGAPSSAPGGAPGRRSARSERRGPGPASVLAVLAPAVALAAALLVSPAEPVQGPRPPSTADLVVSALSCPGAGESVGGVLVSSLASPGTTGGEVRSGLTDPQPVPVVPGEVTQVATGPDATVLAATGALAPGLFATRVVADPLAAVPCRPLASDQWFTGAGAAAEHRSVLELVNPDAGPAVADITLFSPTGPVDAPSLRGVAVAAGTTAGFDLSQVAPRRGDLTVRVQTTRGRLGASVLDVEETLGTGAVTSDWLPAQSAPARVTTMVGLARGPGARRLVVGNPGDDEVQVEVEVLTPRAVFTPEGLTPFRVPPASSVRLSLDDLLAEAAARGGLGLRVTATAPVTTGLRQLTPDLSALAALDEVRGTTGLVVPPGRARLQLVGADTGADPAAEVPTVLVRALDAAGVVLREQQVELAAGTASNTALPGGTAQVVVEAGEVGFRGAVVLRDPGLAVLPLSGVELTSDVPDVRPGLP